MATSKAVRYLCKSYLFSSSLKKTKRGSAHRPGYLLFIHRHFSSIFENYFVVIKLLYALYSIFSITAVFQAGQAKWSCNCSYESALAIVRCAVACLHCCRTVMRLAGVLYLTSRSPGSSHTCCRSPRMSLMGTG